jgi:hypothetical protein
VTFPGSEIISKSEQNGRWERSLIESVKNKNERTVNALVLDHRWEGNVYCKKKLSRLV